LETPLEAVVFDMDGLMFNTEYLYDLAGQQLLKPRGHEYTRELKLMMMGLPGPKAFAVMINHLGLDDSIEQLKSEVDEIFQSLLPEKIETMPGLQTLLVAIDSAGLPRAVATSSHRGFADRSLGQFNLKPGFQFVLTADDVTNGKPNPEVYQTAGRKLGVNPAAMLVLEDSVFGSQAAASAGAYTIAIPTKHSRGQDFSHVDLVVERLDSPEVLRCVETKLIPAKIGN